jgi:hypothetical protein
MGGLLDFRQCGSLPADFRNHQALPRPIDQGDRRPRRFPHLVAAPVACKEGLSAKNLHSLNSNYTLPGVGRRKQENFRAGSWFATAGTAFSSVSADFRFAARALSTERSLPAPFPRCTYNNAAERVGGRAAPPTWAVCPAVERRELSREFAF